MSSPRLKKPRLSIVVRRVVGHSMLPVLPPGTLVIAHKYVKTLIPGQVVIAEHEGKEKVKRVSEIKGNQIFLAGDHPDETGRTHDIGWVEQDQVIARVFWPRRLKT